MPVKSGQGLAYTENGSGRTVEAWECACRQWINLGIRICKQQEAQMSQAENGVRDSELCGNRFLRHKIEIEEMLQKMPRIRWQMQSGEAKEPKKNWTCNAKQDYRRLE